MAERLTKGLTISRLSSTSETSLSSVSVQGLRTMDTSLRICYTPGSPEYSLTLVTSATATLDSCVFEARNSVAMENLAGVASLDVAPTYFVWHTGEDSLYARVQCPGFLTLAAHTSNPHFICAETSLRISRVLPTQPFKLAMYASESPRIIWPRFVLWNGDISARTLADVFSFGMRLRSNPFACKPSRPAVVSYRTRGDAHRPRPDRVAREEKERDSSLRSRMTQRTRNAEQNFKSRAESVAQRITIAARGMRTLTFDPLPDRARGR